MAQLMALVKGHRIVDAARGVREMNIARVAYHANKTEAEEWIAEQGSGTARRKPEDLRAAWRASLEALGITVEE